MEDESPSDSPLFVGQQDRQDLVTSDSPSDSPSH